MKEIDKIIKLCPVWSAGAARSYWPIVYDFFFVFCYIAKKKTWSRWTLEITSRYTCRWEIDTSTIVHVTSSIVNIDRVISTCHRLVVGLPSAMWNFLHIAHGLKDYCLFYNRKEKQRGAAPVCKFYNKKDDSNHANSFCIGLKEFRFITSFSCFRCYPIF